MDLSLPTSDHPIGIFDSGLGGLTVLRELLKSFPKERFLYLGDTARLPYGNKSSATIRDYLEQNIEFLLNHRVKAIVVACNSASSVLEEDEPWPVPVYGVIQPGARTALQVSQTRRIGVIGTRATIGAHAYVYTLKKIDSGVQIFEQACPLLVPLVEEGWEDDPLTNLVVYRYLNPLKQVDVDTLILGCTHYPALKNAIGNVMGANVALVDSAHAIAELIHEDVAAGRLVAASATNPEERFRLLTTDVNDGFKTVAARLMAPHPIQTLIHVHLR